MEEVIDVVLIDDAGERERISIRGECGFCEFTTVDALRDVVEKELTNGEFLMFVNSLDTPVTGVDGGEMLSEIGVRDGCTVFVSVVSEDTVVRNKLLEAISALEKLGVDRKLQEFEKRRAILFK